MDNLTTKYIIFAVGLFITIIVITMIVSTYGEIRGIYEGVSETNISIKDLYDDINIQYNGTVQNGIDLINTVKKYENERYIEVQYPKRTEVIDYGSMRGLREGKLLTILMEQNGTSGSEYEAFVHEKGPYIYKYTSEFDVTVNKNGSKTIIKFEYIP